MIETITSVLTPIHKEGYKFIAIFAAATLFLFLFSNFFGVVGLILTLWCVYFFRDPIRVVPQVDSYVVSPADGLVQKIVTAVPPAELGMGDEEMTRVSIFLNVFDVHVNRIPISGNISALHYHPGKFFNASLDKASVDNERQSILIETADNKKIAVVQIAGLVARRIVCDLNENDQVKTGDRFGIIRFGSRVDVYLPLGINPSVVEGQRAIGGETVIADMKGSKPALEGIRN